MAAYVSDLKPSQANDPPREIFKATVSIMHDASRYQPRAYL
jgi:hypothetical protein